MISHVVQVRCRECAAADNDDKPYILGEFYDSYWACITSDKHNALTGYESGVYLLSEAE